MTAIYNLQDPLIQLQEILILWKIKINEINSIKMYSIRFSDCAKLTAGLIMGEEVCFPIFVFLNVTANF